MPAPYVCAHCSKSFTTSQGANSHARIHADSFEASREQQRIAHQRQSKAFQAAYLAANRSCKHCGEPLPYGTAEHHRRKTFCDTSCAAKHNNKGRSQRSAAALSKLSKFRADKNREEYAARKAKNPPADTPPKPPRPKKAVPTGPYSKLVACRCSHCGVSWFGRSWTKYCLTHTGLYGANGRNKYAFAFNPYLYPDIFGSDVLKWCESVGVYSHANRNGWTRDHKISVTDAIRHDYDPFYIRHPLNCELMTFQANNKKKGASTLAYSDLTTLVDAYEHQKVKSPPA